MLHTFFMFKPRLGAAGKQKHKVMFPIKNQLEAFINEKCLFQGNSHQDIEDGINKLTEEAANILYCDWKRGEINNGSVNQDTEDKMVNDYCNTLNNLLLEYNVNSASVEKKFKKAFAELKTNKPNYHEKLIP